MENGWLAKFIPGNTVHSIYDIRLDERWEQGSRYIITDLDNTLVGAGCPLATPELAAWLKQVELLGWQVVIVSNNSRSRVSAFAEPLGIPYIHKARKPARKAFLQAMAMMKAVPEQTIMIGDQLMTDIFGGNRLGLYTVWVSPIAMHEEGFFTRINRRLERFVIARLKRRGHTIFRGER